MSAQDFLQATFYGLTSGSIYAVAAVGLTLVYGVLRLSNFAHGDFLTFGAYAAYVVTVTYQLHFVLGLVVATIMTAILGVATEFAIWRPLRKKNAGLLQLLLMSIGLALFIRYALQFAFSGGLRRLDIDVITTYDLGPIRVSSVQLITIGSAAVILVLLGMLLARTLVGKSMRALSDNFDLAESSGIDTNRLIVATWVLAGGLAGLGGVLAAMSLNVRPTMGWEMLLTLFAAVIVGGIGNAYGALLGGYLLGFAQEYALLFPGFDSRYKPAVGFLVLIIMLILRPQGILGRKGALN